MLTTPKTDAKRSVASAKRGFPADVAARANFPILAASCRDGTGPLVEGLRTHVVIPLTDSLRMGVIGLTAPWGDAYETFGLYLPDFITVAHDLVGELSHQGVSPIVVLSHLGLEDDRRLAAVVPGINLIVGGHFHDRLLQGEEVDGVLIAQAGQYGEALGRVDLSLDPDTGEMSDRSACVLEVPKDEPPDSLVLEAISAAGQEIDGLIARPVGELQEALDLDQFTNVVLGTSQPTRCANA
jgi:2',3'-cyclic-nucleotide 2'-phosphodiesterase (5'-nucleotidase family)